MTLRDELPRLVVAQYDTGEEWGKNPPERIKSLSQSKKKKKKCLVVDETSDGSSKL